MPKKFINIPLALLLSINFSLVEAAEITIAAAASLTDAFKEAGTQFMQEFPDIKIHFTFAGSGALLAQIAQGAPVDVFASADQYTMDQAQDKSLLAKDTRVNFARNQLVLITSPHFNQPLTDLKGLTQPELKRIAISNPDSVPVGRYSKAVLENEELWQSLNDKIVFTQNVRQSLNYAVRGEVDAAFVYSTDAASVPSQAKVALTIPLDEAILYPIATTADSKNSVSAQKFIHFILSSEGQAILARFGFSKP